MRIRRLFCALALLAGLAALAPAQEAVAPRVIVSAAVDRLPDAESGAPFSAAIVTAEELRHAPQVRLDDILRAQIPGFSLFRRSSGRAAHPTTQGVTLRSFGPNGAGRTLVLLDGIPLNDPFAGYVLWNQVPPSSLQSVLALSGGGAGLFGNAALAGTIFLQSRPADETALETEVLLDTTETLGLSGFGTIVNDGARWSMFMERFNTGGYHVLRVDQRGPVDRRANAETSVAQLGAELDLGRESAVSFRLRGFEDERENGTALTRNDTEGLDASAAFTTRIAPLDAGLTLSGYLQRRRFRSNFSSINQARDLETPSLDQFHVPAFALGGSAVWDMPLGGEHHVTLGADLRRITGETNEAFRFMNNVFTRVRRAGGNQLFLGAFAQDTWKITPAATIVGAVRIDRWELFDGGRREWDRLSGATTLQTDFPDRNGYVGNGRLGTRVQFSPELSVRAAGYTGFRVPTLNELYRPFRVGNAITEANPALAPERLVGGEVGFDWRPAPAFHLAATAFYNHLEDAVGNVTIGFGPGTFDPGGFVPAGGVLRQRRNLELVTAPGFELSGRWQICAQLALEAQYIFTDPRIARANEPAIVDKLLAQTPRHVATGALVWRPLPKWFFTAQARYHGRQFEDDQNSAALAAFTVFDAALAYDFVEWLTVQAKVENLFDTEVETGRSPDGLISVGGPRLATLQVQLRL